MPVLGAVITLPEPTEARARTLAALAADPRLTLGEATRGRLPVVLSTDSRDEDRALWRSLEQLPGVMHLELAFADFADIVQPEPSP